MHEIFILLLNIEYDEVLKKRKMSIRNLILVCMSRVICRVFLTISLYVLIYKKKLILREEYFLSAWSVKDVISFHFMPTYHLDRI